MLIQCGPLDLVRFPRVLERLGIEGAEAGVTVAAGATGVGISAETAGLGLLLGPAGYRGDDVIQGVGDRALAQSGLVCDPPDGGAIGR